MRLKYLNFLFELEICFWQAANFKPCCLQHNILCSCYKLLFYTKSGWHKPSAFKAFRIKLIKVKIRK